MLIGASIEGNSNSNIIITDNIIIEISNLSWLFFSNNHIGKNKAVIYVEEVKKINKKNEKCWNRKVSQS